MTTEDKDHKTITSIKSNTKEEHAELLNMSGDPELGQTDGASPVASPSKAPAASGLLANKKPLLIGAGCAVAALVIGLSVGIPVSRARKNAAAAAGDNGGATTVPEGPVVVQANALPFRFPERVQPLTMNVMAGYDSCGDLLQDVKHALQSMANEQIEAGRNMECWWDPNGPIVYDYQEDYMPCPMEVTMDFADAPTSATANKETSSGASTEDSFGTNNQVEGVDEADIIKSNGEHIFMGYGDEVIVIDLSGNLVERVAVPLPPNATQTLVDENENATSVSRKSMWPCGGPPAPQFRRVVSLLMHEDGNDVILNVITTFDDWQCQTSLCGGLTTTFIYKFSGGKLELMAQQDINGRYNNARAIQSVNHIVTSANVDSWKFTGPLYRCDQAYWNMTYDEYQEAALAKANATVDEYAENITKGLSWAMDDASGNACKHVVQISSMTTGDQDLSLEEKRSLSLFNGQGVLQNFVQITSMDLLTVTPAANAKELGTVETNAAGAFMAQYDPELYATESDLVLAGRGWRYNTDEEWDEYTFLMTFDLTGDNSATPRAIGEVTGYLKDQFSMDMYQDSLRVATTSFQKWKRVENKETKEVSWEIGRNSTSQVSVLQANGRGALEQVGFVGNLGPSEDIKSVRFIKDRGYVVTFRTVDPLYSLDLSNPKKPQVMGELKITGFSEYMHPISGGAGTSVGDFLLTVGQEANETDGRVTGTKISVFDVREITKPATVADYVMENNGGWSGSDAAYDHLAFRYLEESKKLIIPLYVYDWQNQTNNFDGFVVYDIDIPNQEISVTGTVTHTEGQDTFGYCWGSASLPSRSMVFKGDLMTFKSHSIKMTKDVNSLVQEAWPELNLDANRTKDDQCFGYWPWLPFF